MRLTIMAFVLIGLMGCSTPRIVSQHDDGARVTVLFDRSVARTIQQQGLADPSTGRGVTADDPVRIASVSKLAVAIIVMRVNELGRLDLDRPVGDYLGYPVVNPAFPQQPVTVRRLLSHTASLRDHDDQYAIPLGELLKDVLDEPASWDRHHGPDQHYFTYANMNFPVIASVVERVMGDRFDRVAARLLFDPLHMDACFNWVLCSDRAAAQAVVLTQGGVTVRDDLGGRKPACPLFVRPAASCTYADYVPGTNGALFAPQGGLRISARDLARIGQLLANEGVVDGVRILRAESVRAMTRAEWQFDGRNGNSEGRFYCRYGLGVMLIATTREGCADNPGVHGGDWVGHAGEAYGLRSGLWIDRTSGHGIAYYTTGLAANPPKGRSAFTAAEETQVRAAVTQLQQHP